MPHFLCKLVAPRATFPGDMTSGEAELMGRHAAFWLGQAEAGTAIAVGPVADPAGFWGLAIVEAADESSARGILAEDPVTTDGSGFKYELYSMPQIILRAPQAAA
jgi:uncharacterized protein